MSGSGNGQTKEDRTPARQEEAEELSTHQRFLDRRLGPPPEQRGAEIVPGQEARRLKVDGERVVRLGGLHAVQRLRESVGGCVRERERVRVSEYQ